MNKFQLVSHAYRDEYFLGFRFSFVAIRISTVKLKLPDNYGYETCVFYGRKKNEVVDTYETMEEAIEGHKRVCAEYGASKKIQLKC